METDVEAIRQSALALLNCKIEPNPTFPFLCNHPFTNAPFAALDNKLLDLTKPTETLRWRTAMRSVIQKKNAQGIFLLMNPPYRLFFLNLIRSVLSDNDFGELFRAFWPSVEQINGDKNLTRRSIIRLLQSVPKDCLMDKECFLAYQQLPQVFSVYRGVTPYNESRHRAISWTSDIDIAQWFATRYGEHGTIWRANVKKQWVLALLEGKEHEILIDIPKGMPVMNIDPCDPEQINICKNLSTECPSYQENWCELSVKCF